MDTTLLLEGIRDIGLAAMPVVLAWVGNHVHNQTLRDTADQAIERAAGIAYHYLATRLAGTNVQTARQQAVDEGVDYLRQMIPDTLRKLGITDGNKLQAIVKAQLGKLLATDPNVTVKVAPPPAEITVPIRASTAADFATATAPVALAPAVPRQ
jgi:hypothetical protein